MGPLKRARPRSQPRTAGPDKVYVYKEPAAGRVRDLEEAWQAVLHGPLSGRSNAQRERNWKRFYQEFVRWAADERSDAYYFARGRMMVAIYPQSKGKTIRQLEARHGPTFTRMERLTVDAGLAEIVGERASTDKRDYKRTYLELLAPGEQPFANVHVIGKPARGSQGWHFYTELAARGCRTEPVSEAQDAPEEPAQQPLFAAAEEQASLSFSEVLFNPSRENSAPVWSAGSPLTVRPSSSLPLEREATATGPIDALERLRCSSWPSALDGWRTAAGGAVVAGAAPADRAEAVVELVVEAVRAGAPPLPALRFAYELLSGDRPSLNRVRARQLETALGKMDRASAVGEGAAWLVARMFEQYVERLPSASVPGHHWPSAGVAWTERAPRSFAGWAVVAKRQGRRWIRAAQHRRRTRPAVEAPA